MLRMLALSRHGNGALPNLLEIEIINAVAHLGREPLTLFGDRDAKPLDGRARHLAALFELVEDEQLDIELADRAERLGQTADRTRQLFSLWPRGHQRQSGPQTPRGHPRVMQRRRIARLRGGQRAAKRGDALADEIFRSRSAHNA